MSLSADNMFHGIGRIGNDLELKYTTKTDPPRAMLRISMAINASYVDAKGERREQTDWITVVAFHKKAEHAYQNVEKGCLIGVAGPLRTRKYEAANGELRYVTEVVADSISYIQRKKSLRNQPRPDASAAAGSSKQEPGKAPPAAPKQGAAPARGAQASASGAAPPPPPVAQPRNEVAVGESELDEDLPF